jgi:hypothetical protein
MINLKQISTKYVTNSLTRFSFLIIRSENGFLWLQLWTFELHKSRVCLYQVSLTVWRSTGSACKKVMSKHIRNLELHLATLRYIWTAYCLLLTRVNIDAYREEARENRNIRTRWNLVRHEFNWFCMSCILTGFENIRAGLPRDQSSSPREVTNFPFSMSLRLARGPTQPPIEWTPRIFFPGGKTAEAWNWLLTN